MTFPRSAEVNRLRLFWQVLYLKEGHVILIRRRPATFQNPRLVPYATQVEFDSHGRPWFASGTLHHVGAGDGQIGPYQEPCPYSCAMLVKHTKNALFQVGGFHLYLTPGK